MSDFSLSKPRPAKGSGALGPVRDALAALSGWQAMFVAAVLGAVGNMAFAPFHVVAALAVSYTGLIWLLDGGRRQLRWGRSMFARSFAFFFGHYLAGMHWIAAAFLVDAQSHALFLWIPIILLPAILASVMAVAIMAAGAFWSSSPSRVFMFTFFFMIGELVRGHLFGGFPWNLPGTAWAPGASVSQLASLGGLYWLSLLTVFILSAPAALSDDRTQSGLAVRAMPLFLSAIILALGWSWGAQRLQAPTQFTEQQVVLIDAGIPLDQKYTTSADLQLRRYLQLLQASYVDGSDIVVWPESPIRSVGLPNESGGLRPVGLMQWPDALDAIAAQLGSRKLISGTELYGESLAEPAYNALAVLDGPTAQLGPSFTYYKFRLVPLGELAAAEFIPFGRRIAGILPTALQEMASSGFSPGPGPEAALVDEMPTFVPLVCYEALFPAIARKTAPEADWLVNISLDGWFGTGIGPQQHYAQARFRAIETGRPLARVASRGVTAMVDSFGRETARGARQPGDPDGWQASMVRTPLPEKLASTVYLRYGMALFWVNLVSFVGFAALSWRR
jgi:apolipoprotein N-acyltransferase